MVSETIALILAPLVIAFVIGWAPSGKILQTIGWALLGIFWIIVSLLAGATLVGLLIVPLTGFLMVMSFVMAVISFLAPPRTNIRLQYLARLILTLVWVVVMLGSIILGWWYTWWSWYSAIVVLVVFFLTASPITIRGKKRRLRRK